MGKFPSNDEEWNQLIETRRDAVREFLEWANSREQSGRSVRLASRDDLRRVREIEWYFTERWWAVVVYTCFDSVTGTRAVAPYFQQPVEAVDAEALLANILSSATFGAGPSNSARQQGCDTSAHLRLRQSRAVSAYPSRGRELPRAVPISCKSPRSSVGANNLLRPSDSSGQPGSRWSVL